MEKFIRKMEAGIPSLPQRRRVAAYARVSSGKDAMLHSLSAQVSYYSEHIQRNPEWSYAGVYVDEALTGTKDNREGFQRLLADCRAGKIDMVLTKSISRFARNMVTLLETVRELKTLGVDVYFEEQNIHSLNGDGELLLTILASYAQEESRSVSENCKWRIRNQFRAGEPANWRFMYGYRIQHGKITVHPVEAEVVREVFRRYLEGKTVASIAGWLRERAISESIATECGRPNACSSCSKREICGKRLAAEKVCHRPSFKKGKAQLWRLPRYYAEGTHPAIVSPETFKRTQEQIERNRVKTAFSRSRRRAAFFTGMLVCGQCGKKYKRKMNRGKPSWNCTTYLRQSIPLQVVNCRIFILPVWAYFVSSFGIHTNFYYRTGFFVNGKCAASARQNNLLNFENREPFGVEMLLTIGKKEAAKERGT